MRRNRGARLLWLVCLLAYAPHVAAESPTHKPYDALLPNPQWAASDPASRYHAVRVVDAQTGTPIADADVSGYDEDLDPRALRYDRRLGHANTNADGIAWMLRSEGSIADVARDRIDHWLIRAAGFAPAYHFGYDPPPVVRLERGTAGLHARLANAVGEPLTGAVLDLYLGCPHGPVFASVTSDAQGRVVFPACLPDLALIWCVTKGAQASRQLSVMELVRETAQGNAIRLQPGRTLTGRVVDDAGKPVAGAVVRAAGASRPREDKAWIGAHRGPATVTDATGSFALHGLDEVHANQGVIVATADGEQRVWRRVPHTPAPALEIALNVETVDGSDDATGTLKLDVQGGAELPNAIAVRADGLTEQLADDITFVHTLPVGTWTLHTESAFARHTFTPVAVVITKDTQTTQRVRLRATHLLVLGHAQRTSGSLTLQTPHESYDTSIHDVQAGEVYVPTELPVGLIGYGWRARLGPALGRMRSVDVPIQQTTTLTIKGADVDTAYLTLPGTIRSEDELERLEVEAGKATTRCRGALVAHIEDDQDHTWRVPFVAKADGTPVTLTCSEETLVPRAPTFLAWKTAKGEVPEDVEVHVDHEHGWWGMSGAVEPNEELVGPCTVRLRAPGYQPMAGHLAPGKHTWTWGPHALVIESFTPDGTRAPAVVMIDGYLHRDDGKQPLRVDGLQPGKHRVLVTPLDPQQRGVQFEATLDGPELAQRATFSAR